MAITLTEFGKTLRKARIDHDISLKDLADLLNLSPAFLSGVETGRKAVNPSLINKITSVMNLSKTESEELNIAASKTLKEVSLRRLSENPNWRVLVIEAGDDPPQESEVNKILLCSECTNRK